MLLEHTKTDRVVWALGECDRNFDEEDIKLNCERSRRKCNFMTEQIHPGESDTNLKLMMIT